ncbi:MAG: sulfurtransferase [Eubacterium sp.]
MVKTTKLRKFAVGILAVSMTVCFMGLGQSSFAAAKKSSTFTGKYVYSAAQAKKALKNKSVKLVDTRGADAIKKSGTIKGASTMVWQQISHTPMTDGTQPGEAGFARSLSAKGMSKALGKLGLGVNDKIILISDGYASGGWGDDGRVAWQLIQCGYKNVHIVNGGVTALKKAGMKTTKSVVTRKAKKVTIKKVDTTSHDITTNALKKNYSKYKIIDSRTVKEYKGAQDYGETKGGHLKGAVNIPFASMFNKNGTLKSNAALTAMFKKAGINKNDYVVTYCTGGIRSGYMQLVLQQLGYKHTYNYAESVYRWSNTDAAGTADYWVNLGK